MEAKQTTESEAISSITPGLAVGGAAMVATIALTGVAMIAAVLGLGGLAMILGNLGLLVAFGTLFLGSYLGTQTARKFLAENKPTLAARATPTTVAIALLMVPAAAAIALGLAFALGALLTGDAAFLGAALARLAIGLALAPIALALPRLLRRHQRAKSLPVVGGDETSRFRTVGDVTSSLERLAAHVETGMGADVVATVRRIADQLTMALPKEGRLNFADRRIFVARQMALEYLPEALNAYLALPRHEAETVALADGRTARAVLDGQLTLLEDEAARLASDFYRDEAEELVVHERFLRDHFGRSQLALEERERVR